MLVSFVSTDVGIGRVIGDAVELLDLPYVDLGALLRDRRSLADLERADVRAACTLPDVEIHPPVRPGNVWGVGLNYYAKAARAGRAIPTEPILYLKASSAVTTTGRAIPRPSSVQWMDYEGEVAVVIGRRAKCITAAVAWDHIAGITAANDVTARDVMRAVGNPTLAKSFDGFGSLGGSLLPVHDVRDLKAVRVVTTVNGETRQESDTSDLVFSIPELLARLSQYATLEPCDVVLTGTPWGTGEDLGRPLEPGDVVTVRVEGVIPLENWIVASVDGSGKSRPGRVPVTIPTRG